MSFDYSSLPREYPRRFLPARLDVVDLDQLESVFDELRRRPIKSKEDLEKWLDDESEFAAAIHEESAIRYIRMTCRTDDEERQKAYLYFLENIAPKVKLRFFELDRKYLSSPARKELAPDQYFVLDRDVANSVALFREENVELEKEEAKLAQQYQKLGGARTVFYQGRERTMQQMAQYLEEVNRHARQETWQLSEDRRLKDREILDQFYSQLIVLRQKIAKNAGFENYRDYAFRKRERFDYAPEDCFRFHEAVEQYIVPLVRDLDRERADRLDVDPLRPWDIVVDTSGRPPLKPFNNTGELVERYVQILSRIDSDFVGNFRRMAELGLLDLESRPGKAPGGYCDTLSEIRLPFIFLNLVGRDGDARSLMHESGHAFHAFATREANMNFQYRGWNAPLEFAEVASMSMELLGGDHIEGTFYNHEDAVRSRRSHLQSIVRLLAWIATIDSFQHWVYTNPEHTSPEREEFWLKLRERFGGIESWDGYEDMQRSYWQRQTHLFTSPFYYIEYGIAQLGALGVWTRYRRDPKAAVEAYKRALALGGSRTLPELFEAADLSFDFGPSTIEPCTLELRAELEDH